MQLVSIIFLNEYIMYTSWTAKIKNEKKFSKYYECLLNVSINIQTCRLSEKTRIRTDSKVCVFASHARFSLLYDTVLFHILVLHI